MFDSGRGVWGVCPICITPQKNLLEMLDLGVDNCLTPIKGVDTSNSTCYPTNMGWELFSTKQTIYCLGLNGTQ